jgi:DNA-binding MarR family transcriptional regulator
MQKRVKNGSPLDGVVFHLLHRASQRADDLFANEVGDADLTSRQFAVLVAVASTEDPSQTDIVEITGIDRSTTAEMIRRLVKKGLLQRRRRREDARAYVVRLSDGGRAALKSAQSKAARADGVLLARLSGEQRKALVEALSTISVGE